MRNANNLRVATDGTLTGASQTSGTHTSGSQMDGTQSGETIQTFTYRECHHFKNAVDVYETALRVQPKLEEVKQIREIFELKGDVQIESTSEE